MPDRGDVCGGYVDRIRICPACRGWKGEMFYFALDEVLGACLDDLGLKCATVGVFATGTMFVLSIVGRGFDPVAGFPLLFTVFGMDFGVLFGVFLEVFRRARG